MQMSAVSRTGEVLAATLLLGGCASAPESSSSAAGTARVDLTVPRFDDSTSVTNPLFPISALAQVIQVGAEAGAPLRNEVTLLPRTRSIEWDGGKVQTLVSQYVGYRDGQIIEVGTTISPKPMTDQFGISARTSTTTTTAWWPTTKAPGWQAGTDHQG